MNEQEKNISSNGEPETTQAPSPSEASAITKPGTLPDSYLSEGSMLEEDGALRPEYIGRYAQALAGKLKPLPASTFYSAFLREAKVLRKKKTPYGAQKNCALGMVTQAKKLVHRKKDPAPAVLLDMITAATSTVRDPASFEALYMHLDAVYSYLLD